MIQLIQDNEIATVTEIVTVIVTAKLKRSQFSTTAVDDKPTISMMTPKHYYYILS